MASDSGAPSGPGTAAPVECPNGSECVDPRGAPGESCESDVDCQELPCVDGVCCESTCEGACQSCGESGACETDPNGVSCGESRQCGEQGRCALALGAECGADADCGSDHCAPAVGGGSACCEEACESGSLCNADGVCVSPEADLGTPCSSNEDCIGGRCFDGRCCDVACGGVCERCNAPGREGRCVGAPAGEADPACGTGLECAERGQCRQALGTACELDTDCRSSVCGPPLTGSGDICCEEPCAEGQRCASDGACVEARKPDGDSCRADADCINANCLGSRCCESTCPDGQGCDPEGRCFAPAQLVGFPTREPGISFGAHLVQTTTTAVWQVMNTGGVTTGGLAASESPNSADFSVNTLNCPALSPGQVCDLVITFTPQSTGTKSTVLSLQAANGGATASVRLTGVGQQEVRVGEVAALADSFNYGADFMLAHPITVAQPAVLTGFGLITRQGGTNVRMGLYQESGAVPDNVPSLRVAQTSSTLLRSGVQEIAIPPVEIAAGSYWVVTLFDAQTAIAVNISDFLPVRHLREGTPFATGLPADFRTAGNLVNDAWPRSNVYLVLLE